jgi:hypothetical protein
MAKAKQVGTPHSPQLVFGSFLKISIPVRAISYSFSRKLSALSTPLSAKTRISFSPFLLIADR